MTAVILDRHLERQLIAQRRRRGIDQYDEVWDGVYFMAPAADIQHQSLVGDLNSVISGVVRAEQLGLCVPAVNISDRRRGWRKNYRVPDVAVFLKGNPAEDCGTFWFGGPDLAVEIVSPRDRTRKKIPFYEKIGTRELLVIDRRPWRLTFYRGNEGQLNLDGESTFASPLELNSGVVPLSFRLAGSEALPRILVGHRDGRQQWLVEVWPKKP
jgi:Uma2 family endonuclease